MAKRFLLLAVLISGCTFHYMGKGLNALVGKDVRYAFDVLGYPNGKQECGGDMVRCKRASKAYRSNGAEWRGDAMGLTRLEQ
jgi:hypothetical protein